jgi:heptosyltransferase-2
MRILLVQTSYLGDTILSTPLIAALKSLYAEADLWMMTTPVSTALVTRDPLLKGVIPFDKRGRDAGFAGLLNLAARLRKMEFDRVYSLHRSWRTAFLLYLSRIPFRTGFRNARFSFVYHRLLERNPSDHDVIRNLSLLSGEAPIADLDSSLRLFAPEIPDLSDEVRRSIPQGKPYAVIVPGSAWATKMWDFQGYHQVAAFLLNHGIQVVLLGSANERCISTAVAGDLDVVNLTGCTRMDETMHIIRQSKLVICNDSMSLHIASAFKVPNVAIFCATSPEFGFSPWKNRAIVVQREDLACKPCRRHGSPRCPNGTEACTKGLSHTEVIRAVKELIDIP